MNAIPEPVQPASLELVLADYIKAEGVEVAETYKPILAYVSNLASNQCIAETFHMFEWEKTCQAYLEPIMDAEKAAVVTKKFIFALARGTARPSGLQSPVAFAPPCVIKKKIPMYPFYSYDRRAYGNR